MTRDFVTKLIALIDMGVPACLLFKNVIIIVQIAPKLPTSLGDIQTI
jgi:hypothetical protein